MCGEARINESTGCHMINVANAVAKWSRNTAGATQAYKDGINAVTESPMALAAAQAPKAAQNYAEAINSGRWAQRLQSVPLEVWKQQSANVGASRLASGVQKGTAKMQAALTKFAPAYEQAKQAARAITGTGEAAAMEKVAVVYRILKQAAGKPL